MEWGEILFSLVLLATVLGFFLLFIELRFEAAKLMLDYISKIYLMSYNENSVKRVAKIYLIVIILAIIFCLFALVLIIIEIFHKI